MLRYRAALLGALAFALLAVVAYGQTQQPVGEVAQKDEPAIFKARVNLVPVPVVVRDRKGQFRFGTSDTATHRLLLLVAANSYNVVLSPLDVLNQRLLVNFHCFAALRSERSQAHFFLECPHIRGRPLAPARQPVGSLDIVAGKLTDLCHGVIAFRPVGLALNKVATNRLGFRGTSQSCERLGFCDAQVNVSACDRFEDCAVTQKGIPIFVHFGEPDRQSERGFMRRVTLECTGQLPAS